MMHEQRLKDGEMAGFDDPQRQISLAIQQKGGDSDESVQLHDITISLD